MPAVPLPTAPVLPTAPLPECAAAQVREFATTLDITATIVGAAGGIPPADYQGFDLLRPIAAGLDSPRLVGIACEYRASGASCPARTLPLSCARAVPARQF